MPTESRSISVIIPAYNQAPYVAKSIGSVLEQTFGDLELIVVDDGSTDETPAILAAVRDPRFRVIRQPNAGLSAARNTGLLASRAPLVTFLDADDYFLPDKLAVLARYLADHPQVGLVIGAIKYVDQAGAAVLEPPRAGVELGLPGLLAANPICVSAVLLRRSWLAQVGLFDEGLRACEDWDLWLRLARAGCQMAWVEHTVVAYRLHSGQMTRQAERMRKALLTMLDKFFGDPGLPAELRAYKNQAYAAAFVQTAALAYLSAAIEQGQQDLAEAVRLNPGLKQRHCAALINLLVGWSQDPRSSDPAAFLEGISAHLPAGLTGLAWPLRRAIADVELGSLFKSPREIRRAHRRDLLKVLLYKPAWLFNRGVLSMTADAWLHLS